MSLLLDTRALLWFLSNDPKLSAAARAAIEELANVRWVSPASLFEIAIKVRTGKLKLLAPFVRGDVSHRTPGGRHPLAPPRTISHRASDDSATAPQRPIRPPDRRNRSSGRLHDRVRRPGLRRLRCDPTLVREPITDGECLPLSSQRPAILDSQAFPNCLVCVGI
jgi:hypothetical protein